MSRRGQIPLFGPGAGGGEPEADEAAGGPIRPGGRPSAGPGGAPAPGTPATRAATADGSGPETAISVSALLGATRRLLEDRVPRLWIRGEVAEWKVSSQGHRYFSLRDDRARVSCVMFQGDAWRLPTDPDVGMDVMVFGQATVYEAQGRFQVIVREIETAGEGLWRIAFERLRRTLDAEGLLAPDRKRPIPGFPTRIGIVTSKKGAALHDVLTVLRRRSPWVEILVCDCRVQGEGAAGEIRRALERVSGHGGVDAIILTRGGGSMEDLWSFNDEVAVRAVAACPVPVICAVGHEVDVTLAELVADLRAPTPSVAAELAAPDVRALRRRLGSAAEGLSGGLRRQVTWGRERARRAGAGLERGAARALESGRARLRTEAGRLEALSPLATLARGYAVATDLDGRLLARVGNFDPGRPFRLRLRDGTIRATAEDVEREA